MGEHGGVVVAVVEGDILVADASVHIRQFFCVRRVLDLRLCLYHVEEAAEAGQPLLHRLDELHKDLDRADENADVEGIHCQVRRHHESAGDQVSAVDKRYEVHHSLEEQVPSHEASHTVIVVAL